MATASSTYVLDSRSFNTSTSTSSSSSGNEDDGAVVISCRHCNSPRLITDWKAGDVICTDCGVVAEEHIRDASCEWRIYSKDADDDPNPTAARCGMVPTDERQWMGGLEPTTLSTHLFGGRSSSTSSSSEVLHAKRLKKVQYKVEKLLEKAQKESMREADLSRQLILKRWERRKQLQQQQSERKPTHKQEQVEEEAVDDILIEEGEEQEHSSILNNTIIRNNPNNNKWSLDRAILLHNYEEGKEQPVHLETKKRAFQFFKPKQQNDEVDDEMAKLSLVEKRNLRDLFTCYTLIQNCIAQLSLPTLLVPTIMKTACHYATLTNGLHVPGILLEGFASEKGSSQHNNNNHTNNNSNHEKKKQKMITTPRTTLVNKFKQIGALASALIYIHAKREGGCNRSLTQVCSTMNEQCQRELLPLPSSSTPITESIDIVLPKTCSKAISKLKLHIPDLFYIAAPTPSITTSSTHNDHHHPNLSMATPEHTVTSSETRLPISDNPIPPITTSTDVTTFTLIEQSSSPYAAAANLVPHSAGTILKLPQEATCIISRLALKLGKEQMQLGTGAGTKPTIIGIAVTYLICSAGSIMQRLAYQAIHKNIKSSSSQHVTTTSTRKRKVMTNSNINTSCSSSSANGITRRDISHTSSPISTSGKASSTIVTSKRPKLISSSSISSTSSVQGPPQQQHFENDMLDLLLPAEGSSSLLDKPPDGDEGGETLQGWYEWTRQHSWDRDYKDIEQAYCGKNNPRGAYEYYKVHIFPRRASLLEIANEVLISSNRHSRMTNIATAAPLMLIGKKQ